MINWKFWWWRIAMFAIVLIVLEMLAYTLAANTIVAATVEWIATNIGWDATQISPDTYLLATDVMFLGLLFLPSCTLLTLYAPLMAAAFLLRGNYRENTYIFGLFVAWWYFMAVLRSIMIVYVYDRLLTDGMAEPAAWDYAHNVIGNSILAYIGVAVLILSLTYLFTFSERYGYYAEYFQRLKLQKAETPQRSRFRFW